jgi:hypothetical protein
MRQLFLAVFGVFAVSGVASAQYPQSPPIYPQPPAPFPVASPASAVNAPVLPVSGTTYIGGTGCSSCSSSVGPTTRGFKMVGGHGSGCMLSQPCNSGCGSCKSDFAFQFGSCKNFFSPCGPHGKGGNGGLFGGGCPKHPFAQPWGQGWTCPPIYDSYANH